MKNKNLQIASTILYAASGILLVSSFFVVDNKKAVKRRWLAIGTATLAFGVEIVNTRTALK